MKNFCLLGATGSIGTQTLDIIRKKEDYHLVAFSFGENIEKAMTIIDEFKPQLVVTKRRDLASKLSEEYPSIKVAYGDSALQLVSTFECSNPVVVNALVGSIGLVPTMAALEAHRDILLANKETLVMAGELVMKKASELGVKIIPIDSEHSAIYQLLQDKKIEEVKRIILTASGGPFRNKTREEMEKVSVQEALKHPNWQMGPKITIDCATLMNKGFEVMEAYHLFGLPLEKIDVIIHPESIIHSMVEFNDFSIFAQMGSSDMHLPINYAINQPNHIECDIIKPLDLTSVGSLHFIPLDNEKFPLVELAKDALRKGGIYPAVLNAANEIAVNLYLNQRIKFLDIEKIIMEEYHNPIYEKMNQGELSIIKIINLDEQIKNKYRNM